MASKAFSTATRVSASTSPMNRSVRWNWAGGVQRTDSVGSWRSARSALCTSGRSMAINRRGMGYDVQQIRLRKIVSGGQTGVDHAALDAAIAAGVEVGGWCPSGRRAEDRVISKIYPLQETPSSEYAQRTAWNVRDSDGTLVLTRGEPTGGTALTIQEAKQQRKPLLVVDLEALQDVATLSEWLAAQHIKTLNVAGPRESEAPGIYRQTLAFMASLLA